jgi:UDP-N-acetylmuramoylalanine--D-glutamate ligase
LSASGARVTIYDESDVNLPGYNVVATWDGTLPSESLDLVVTSPGFSREHPSLRAAVERGIPVWSEPELAYRISKVPIIAITGTNGKSTTSYLTYRMLQAAGFRAHLCGNIAGSDEDKPTTQAAMEAQPGDVLVAEISSFQLEWVDGFRPRIAVLTRLDQDHLNRYAGSFEEYAAVKRRIFRRQSAEDFAVIGYAEVPEVASRRISFPRALPGDCAFHREGQMVLRLDGEEHALGEHSDIHTLSAADKDNALAAATAAWLFGARADAIRQALQGFRGLTSRMEVIGVHQGITFIDNSAATNPTSCANAITSSGPNTVPLIGGVAKGNDPAPIVAACRTLERPAVLYGEMAGALAGLFAAAGVSHVELNTLDEAFASALGLAKPGDVVLLAPGGASFDQFGNFLERAERFRQLVLRHGGEVPR